MKKTFSIIALLALSLASIPAFGQYTKPVYVSMPSAGNMQHLALAAAKFKGFYNEMGVTNAQLVLLRGNSINVQALVAGSVPFASAFGPSMHAMFRGEQIRIVLQIFNQIPFSLITRPEIKKLEDLKGSRIAVTFGGSTYSVLIALLAKYGLPASFAEYLNIPGDQAKAAAMMQGRAAAALMAPPADRHLLKEGYKRLIYGLVRRRPVPASSSRTKRSGSWRSTVVAWGRRAVITARRPAGMYSRADMAHPSWAVSLVSNVTTRPLWCRANHTRQASITC